MSVRKLTAKLIAALIMFSAAGSVQAQRNDLPPADPFAFDPDFRWFEPVYQEDLIDVKPKKRANTGWFATYDRIFLYGSRPELQINNGAENLDEGAGHRYELGYMQPQKDTGWLFNWTTNEVGAFDTTRQERVNRYSQSDLNTVGGTGGAGPTNDNPLIPPLGFTSPPADRNNIGFFRRFYDVRQSENVMDFDSYELNKTWRLEPYHYGGILEPMIGFRWIRLDDANIRGSYNSTFNVPNPLVIAGFVGAAEQFNEEILKTENEMLLSQMGFRYFRNHGKFMYSTDFRVFAGQNLQSTVQQQFTETTIYSFAAQATPTIGAAPIAIQNTQTTPIYDRNDEFVVGFDVRGELGYQLTKMISIRTGFQVIDIGRGVWRGGREGVNDQDVQLFGATFGLTLNR